MYILLLQHPVVELFCQFFRPWEDRILYTYQRLTEGVRGGGFKLPPSEIPKALQNRAKLNAIVKTVKNCRI